MTLTPYHFLIVCPLVMLAGFVDSIAGGGGLISLPAYLISGLPVHVSIATNKLSSPMGTAISVFRYAKAGYIDWKLVLLPVLASLLGASIGSNIALLISDTLFRYLMLIILPLTAIYVQRKKNLFTDGMDEGFPFVRRMLICSLIALAVGMYDGFYGPGAGTFLILGLTRFARLDIQNANGIAKSINLASNVSSLFVYLLNGKVLLPLGVCAGVFSILGNYLGSRCFTSKGAAIARPIILAVLLIFFGRTILEIGGVI